MFGRLYLGSKLIAKSYLNFFGSVEDVRAAGGVGEDVDHARGLEPERRAERECLGERLPVDEQRKIDRELHARSGPDRPDMFDAPAELAKLEAKLAGLRTSDSASRVR